VLPDDPAASVRDFCSGAYTDPQQRANVALAIIADLPVELRRDALLYIRNTYPNGE